MGIGSQTQIGGKLRSGTFYNPWHHRNGIDGSKVLMFHAKDDPNIPYARTKQFSEITGAKLKTLQRGGHISTDFESESIGPRSRLSSIRMLSLSVNKPF